MITEYTSHVRYKGQVVRLSRKGYQGYYIYINNKEEFVPDYDVQEL